jgi:hypothetical protein
VPVVPASLHTERLRLDPWGAADAKLLADLARTPAVMRRIGDGTTWTDARIHDVAAHIASHLGQPRVRVACQRVCTTRHRSAHRAQLRRRGAGVGPAYRDRLVADPGRVGPRPPREGAAAVRDEAFERDARHHRISLANAGSLAVAAAIGLSHESESTGRGGETIAVLRVSADAWRLGSGPGRPPAARPGGPA